MKVENVFALYIYQIDFDDRTAFRISFQFTYIEYKWQLFSFVFYEHPFWLIDWINGILNKQNRRADDTLAYTNEYFMLSQGNEKSQVFALSEMRDIYG